MTAHVLCAYQLRELALYVAVEEDEALSLLSLELLHVATSEGTHTLQEKHNHDKVQCIPLLYLVGYTARPL